MTVFDIDIELLITRLIPTKKRAQWHIDWLLSLFKGVAITYNNFLTYKTDTLRILSYNSQRLLFEKAINDDCDATLKRIYIDNAADDIEDSFMWFISEGQDDAYCYQLSEEPFAGRYTFTIFEYNNLLDFTVFVPNVLSSATEKIKAIVNFYKLAGKRYIIKYF